MLLANDGANKQRAAVCAALAQIVPEEELVALVAPPPSIDQVECRMSSLEFEKPTDSNTARLESVTYHCTAEQATIRANRDALVAFSPYFQDNSTVALPNRVRILLNTLKICNVSA